MHSALLRYLDQVARQGSIRKAASLLNTSSTSVNRQIINAENRLGIRLFERSPEGVELTAAGKVVLEHCRKTLYDFEKVQTIIDDLRDLKTGHLDIRTIDSVIFGVLPKILEKFSHEHPGISLSIGTSDPEEISATVVSGETDIGITFTKNMHPELRVFSEKAAPFGIILRPDHPLAERSNVSLEDVVGYPLVRTIDARGHQSLIDKDVEAEGVSLSTHIFTDALTVAKQAILANQAVGIYTKIGFLDELARGDLKYVPLSVKALGEYKIGLITSVTSSIDPVRRQFLNAAEGILRTMNFDA